MCSSFKMVMFGLEGSGFFLSIVFTLLLTGAVVFFMNGRLRGLQSVVVQQAAMLSNLIADFKQPHWGIGGGGASPEALDAARQLSAEESRNSPIELGTVKIDVSDDSCSEAYSSDSDDQHDLQPCLDSVPSEDRSDGVKTITLSDVEDLSAINVDAAVPPSPVTSLAALASALAGNPTYLTGMKVGDLRVLADTLLEGDTVAKKAKKAEIIDALQQASVAPVGSTSDLEKV